MSLVISDSLHPLLTPDIIKKLKDFHVTTISSLLSKPAEQVSSITRINYNKVLKLRRDLFRDHAVFASSGYEQYQSWLTWPALATGCQELDEMVGGGFQPATVYELYGEEEAGRTQLVMTLAAVTAAGKNRSVVYIDTKNDFSSERLMEIMEERMGAGNASNKNSSQSEVAAGMERVIVGKAYQAEELLDAVREVDRKMSISVSGVWSQVKLVVLDNLASPFMPYVGNPSLRTGFTIASHLSQLLHQLAITRNVSVVTVNNARRDGDRAIPALGKMWSRMADVRILMERCDGEDRRRVAVVMGGGALERRCVVNIAPGGIVSA